MPQEVLDQLVNLAQLVPLVRQVSVALEELDPQEVQVVLDNLDLLVLLELQV